MNNGKNPDSLPPNFQEFELHKLNGLSLSERVLEARIRIEPMEFGYRAILFGHRAIRGNEHTYDAISTSHNWVRDGDIIRPLPRDIASSLKRIFDPINLADLSFSDVLALSRSEQDLVEVQLSDDIFIAASKVAESLSGTRSIPGLQGDLFPYQSSGVEWMLKTISQTGGLILADEMGLGKTIQIISLLLLNPPGKISPALVICPTSLIANWKNEISRFAPELSVMIHRGTHRAGIYRDLQISQVVITTYDTAVNDISIISAFEWSWVICDEAQAIKNPSSARRKALSQIPRRRTIPMTGTPVENSLTDLWSLADFAIPGLLGSLQEFESRFPDSPESAIEVSHFTNPIVLRRMVKDVADDLPERIDIDLPILLTEDLANEYERIRKDTLEKYGTAGALVATGQLQMFCAHPWLQHHKADSSFWDENAVISRDSTLTLLTPKIERATSLIHEAFINNHKVLVFSVFNRCSELIQEAMLGEKIGFWRTINGSTAQEERQSIIDEFTDYEGNACLVLNPRAAGSGLNITAATVVIHFTQVWNPALESQASARAHRRGQKNPVTIYRLFYEDTVESVMMERSKWKRELGNEAVPITIRDNADLKRALEISPGREYV